MIGLVFEILGATNFCVAIYYWIMDNADINRWLFFLMLSVIMYLNANRYDENEK